MNAVSDVDPDSQGREYAIQGETPSPVNIPKGYCFHPRCPYAQERCRCEESKLEEVAPGRFAACYFILNY